MDLPLYGFCVAIPGNDLVQTETCSTNVWVTIELKQTCVVLDFISAVYLVINTTGWLP